MKILKPRKNGTLDKPFIGLSIHLKTCESLYLLHIQEYQSATSKTDTCICVADALHSSPQTVTTTINWLHPNIK